MRSVFDDANKQKKIRVTISFKDVNLEQKIFL